MLVKFEQNRMVGNKQNFELLGKNHFQESVDAIYIFIDHHLHSYNNMNDLFIYWANRLCQGLKFLIHFSLKCIKEVAHWCPFNDST